MESATNHVSVQHVVLFRGSREPILDDWPAAIDQRVQIDSDLWIGPLGRDISKKVIKPCEQLGGNHNLNRSDDDLELYSYVWDPTDQSCPRSMEFDYENRLRDCIALSRIVHPTSVSFRYSAIVYYNNKGEIWQITPSKITGVPSSAYVFHPETNRLTYKHACELKKLFAAYAPYRKDGPKEPLRTAFFYHEYASRLYEPELRYLLMVTGIMAILQREKQDVGKQFKHRIIRLSVELGIPLSDAEAEEMYDLRNSMAHTGRLRPLPQATTALDAQKGATMKLCGNEGPLIDKMGEILRGTIKKAFLDNSFYDFLCDANEVNRKWPA